MLRSPLILCLFVPLLARCQGGTGSAPQEPTVRKSPPVRPLALLLDSLHLDAHTVRFDVDKSDRLFSVYAEDTLVKTYPCVLGENPIGDKFCQGDRKTPEGTFTFRSKRVHASWHKFIWVDYPNAESYRRFKDRKAQGLIPAGKDIGGEIGIHGVPEGMDHWIDMGRDWTWGCIALKNTDVDEIYPYIIPERTELTIAP